MSTKKKKIGFVIGALSSGGAERVISTLSNSLIDKYDIVIITFTHKEPFYKIHDNVKIMACKEEINTPNSIFQSLKLNYELVKSVSGIIRSEKLDIIIGFITSANIITTIAAKLNGIPSIISERNNPMKETVPKFWIILRNLVYPKTDKLVLQTQGVKKFYDKKVKSDKITILPNPISSDLTTLRNVNVQKEKIILTVGRLDKSKCQDLLIKAYNNIDVADWKLVIIGYGAQKKALTNLINELKLQGKVEIIEKVRNIQDYYNKAGIFAFVSKNEGFPNALLEAMYFGIPTISTNCDFGPSEIINNEENGFLIPVGDQELLEQRLKTLISEKELRIKFSNNAKLSADNFHSDAVVQKWDEVISSLI